VLQNLGQTLVILNKYFKDNVIGELWDMEKFSLKEATVEPDVEKYAFQLNDITNGILNLESNLMGNPIKNWRLISLLYEQIIIAIDGTYKGKVEDLYDNECQVDQ
jgi:hypothetical protein